MRNLSVFFIFCAISSCYIKPCAGVFALSDALDVVKLAKDVMVALGKAWSLVDAHVDFSEVPAPFLAKTEDKLFSKIALISSKIDMVADRVDSLGTNTIAMVLHNLPERLRLELRLNDLQDYITRVNINFRRLEHYTKHQKDFEKLTLEDFANSVVSHDTSSVVNLVERIHTFIVPEGRGFTDTGVVTLLGKSMETNDNDITYGLAHLDSVWALQLAYSDLRGIYALYDSFRRFQKLQTGPGRIPSPKQAWTDMAETVLNDPENSVEHAIDRVYRIVDENNLYQAVLKEVEGDMLCNSKQSPQQVLYNLYNSIALTELKGYSMIQFSYMLLRLYNQGNFTKEAQIMRERYQERTNNALETVRSAMKNVSRELWNCDPKKHVKGETYEEVTSLIQGFVQNEVDLNPDGTCRENCAEYQYTKSHGCYQNLFCRQQRACNGKIIQCQYFDSDMWICQANPLSGRRYEYIEYENGRVLGRKQSCSRGSTKVDSWWRWLFWHCSYCFCLCDEQGRYSDRYFNMRPVLADIENNKVITGLRFVKKNRILHLTIQEGELLPRGNINATTLHWVPAEDYSITDRHIYNGQDFHTLSWEKRAVDLDTLHTDDGYVLTGIRFKEIGSHLNFEIYMTKFDFETGKLINPSATSVWKDNPNTDSTVSNPRKEIKLNHPDIPIRSTSPSVPTSQTDQFIKFVNSDIDRDAAQTTVPFLDAQKVESLQAVPLAGAGIYHKGRNYFGGFIAPKIITYDFSKHLQAAFPDESVN